MIESPIFNFFSPNEKRLEIFDRIRETTAFNDCGEETKKMGKKDGKRVDQAKLQAKKERQALKQEKANTKRTKKELKDGGEEDIEKIIAEFAAKDAARLAVTITHSPQPSRRANFSMTALPNGEMLMFGGECCDGERTEVYNELYRWNVDRNEWKLIESLNTPPPRCSHQAVLYLDKLYMFGGEYATMDQFYHYRDFWELDLKTNSWSEVSATGDLPSARYTIIIFLLQLSIVFCI